MNLWQLKKELNEIRENVNSHTPRNRFVDVPLTDEVVRCCHEFLRAQAEAQQRLIDSGISEAELKKAQQDSFINDPSVWEAHQNKLRAISNTRLKNTAPAKINFLYGPEPWDDLL